jgi:hypothetical protein
MRIEREICTREGGGEGEAMKRRRGRGVFMVGVED